MSVTDAAFTVLGAAGVNTITFAGTDVASDYTGQDGDDVITLATTEGTATLTLGDGANTVTADDLDVGILYITAGDGDNAIAFGAASTTSEVTISVGDGDNTFTISDDLVTGGVGIVNISVGDGDNTIVVATATSGDAEEWTIDLGTGDNTLDLSTATVDLTTAVLDITGLSNILHDGDDTVDGAFLTGETIELQGDGDDSEQLLVTLEKAGTYNFANITANATLALGTGGLAVTNGTFKVTATLTAADDTYVGGSLVDTVTAGAGADEITGGSGADVLTGGTGSDTFVYTASTDGADTTDFVSADVFQFQTTDVSASGTSDLFGESDIVFANTDGTDTAGTVVALDTGDYNEIAVTGDIEDNMVNVVTTSAGFADVATALNTIDDGTGSVGDNESFILVFGNSDTGLVEMWYVSDSGTTADDFADVVAVELASTSVALTGIATAFSEANFEVISLG